jgi:hypothetical protein
VRAVFLVRLPRAHCQCSSYHAWESLAMKYLHNLSPGSIREEDNSFNKMVRP